MRIVSLVSIWYSCVLCHFLFLFRHRWCSRRRRTSGRRRGRASTLQVRAMKTCFRTSVFSALRIWSGFFNFEHSRRLRTEKHSNTFRMHISSKNAFGSKPHFEIPSWIQCIWAASSRTTKTLIRIQVYLSCRITPLYCSWALWRPCLVSAGLHTHPFVSILDASVHRNRQFWARKPQIWARKRQIWAGTLTRTVVTVPRSECVYIFWKGWVKAAFYSQNSGTRDQS